MRKSKFTTTIDILFGIFVVGIMVFVVMWNQHQRELNESKLEIIETIND